MGVTSGSTPIKSLDSPTAYRIVALLGVVALGASGWLVWRSITGATASPSTVKSNVNSTTTQAVAALEKLKTKDTDGDGISDYDELYLTHTSPYLKDSDGDGIPDNAEIKNGADPNCPTGKVCEGFRLLTTAVDANGNLTPEFLRRSLASAGVAQATLDATDDATLLRIYQQVIKAQPATNTNSAANTNGGPAASNTNIPSIVNSNSTVTPAALTQIQQLTPAAIRQLLIQNGIDPASLNGIDDATLKQIFQEAIVSSQ